MHTSCFIGLDFGSDSVRALLVDESGHELAASVCNYPRWMQGAYCNAAENQFRQHPLDYLESMENVVKAVVEKLPIGGKILGIGIDTTGSTPCAVDETGMPLALKPAFAENPNAMFVLWKDHTAIAEADEITAAAKKAQTNYVMYEGGIYSAEWFWSKVLHILRADNAVRSAAWSFVEHCDWIPAELTGMPAKPSRCAAGHKAMWHASWGGLPPEEFFTSIDPVLSPIRQHLYTDTFTADRPVGKLSEKWAKRLGLTTDVVVSGGAFDCHVGAVGAGIRENQMVKVIGTSTCDVIVSPRVDRCVRGICGQVDGSVLPGMIGLEAGQSAFGDIYAWFMRFISYGGKVDFAPLEKEAASLPDSQVMALDWMNGRRTPDANQKLTGALFGLQLGTTVPMVYRALIESTAFGSRAILERLLEEGVAIDSIIAIGGIAHKSPFCMQFLADVLNRKVSVAASDQTCALGAAMLAAAASGFYPDLQTAAEKMQQGIDAVYTPQKNYDDRYAKYLAYAQAVEKIS